MFLTGPTGEHTSQDAKETIPIGQAVLDKPTKIHKKGKGIEILEIFFRSRCDREILTFILF